MAKKKVGKKKDSMKIEKNTTLDRETFQEMRINQLEMEALKSQLQNIALVIENHERSKQLAVLKRNDVKGAITRLEQKHDKFIDRVKREKGIDIRGKAIHPETLEVM